MRVLVAIFFALSSLFAVSDMLGREVAVKKTDRIIFVGPGALRVGVYLGLEDRMVGIEQFELSTTNPPPYRKALGDKVKKLPVIGAGGPGKLPNFEALIDAKPDFIVASFLGAEQMDQITQKTKIPVVAISYGASYGAKEGKKLDEVMRSIKFLGELTGKEARAKELVAFMHSEQKALALLRSEPKKLYIGGVAYKGMQGIVSTEADYLPFEMIGQKNGLFDGGVGHKFVDLEAIVRLNPEWIFLDDYSEAKWSEELKSPVFTKLDAYKNNRIRKVFGLNNYNTNIENSFIIAYQIASELAGKPVDPIRSNQIYKAFYPNTDPKVFD